MRAREDLFEHERAFVVIQVRDATIAAGVRPFFRHEPFLDVERGAAAPVAERRRGQQRVPVTVVVVVATSMLTVMYSLSGTAMILDSSCS